jgi:hypothetical protein
MAAWYWMGYTVYALIGLGLKEKGGEGIKHHTNTKAEDKLKKHRLDKICIRKMRGTGMFSAHKIIIWGKNINE